MKITDKMRIDWLNDQWSGAIRCDRMALFSDQKWLTKKPTDTVVFTRKHKDLRAAIDYVITAERKARGGKT